MDYLKWTQEHNIVLTLTGSRLYGTARPDSDYDYRGICQIPPTAVLGLQDFEQYQGPYPLAAGLPPSHDIEIYGLTKFIRLALANNPNITDILFAGPQFQLQTSACWQAIYGQRHAFLSQRIRHTFSGYAFAQLKRLQGHRKWLTGEVPREPALADYNGQLAAAKHGAQKLHFAHAEDRAAYETAKLLWDNYQRWLSERNPARAETERRVGYDTKNAGHLVRLLLQCVNILISGDYEPQLHDANLHVVQEVLAGTWSYDDLMGYVTQTQAAIDAIQSPLPQNPDHTRVEVLLMDLNYTHLRANFKP